MPVWLALFLFVRSTAEATRNHDEADRAARSNTTAERAAMEAQVEAQVEIRSEFARSRAYIAPALCLPGSEPCQEVASGSLGKVLRVSRSAGAVHVTVADGASAMHGSKPHLVQLRFESPETLRLQVAPYGHALDAASRVVDTAEEPLEPQAVATQFKEAHDGSFRFSAGTLEVRGHADPFQLTVLRDGLEVFRQERPVSWNASMTTLHARGAAVEGERWYGGGMQNGYAEHTGRRVGVWEGGPSVWDKGGHANPVPFAMSSQGYGFFRNTFSPGEYQFSGGAAMAHAELGLDAYLFAPASRDMKGVLGAFVVVQGRPVVPPVWALGLGDSDCYNNMRHGYDTNSSLPIAKSYAASELPVGWMMVNDGYGCGYSTKTSLERTHRNLVDGGMRMGLWTEKGLEDAPWEIGTAGSRVIKTDVKWVGHGYKFGVDAVKDAAKLMQTYGQVAAIDGAEMEGHGRSSARPFTWTVCGWASTSAYAVVWTGDSSGNWPYIQMQVPSVIGSGLSAQHLASGDVDGIYGGSAETYVRDLQWKTFLPVSMTMSGWSPNVASNQKQPWAFGEPYTSHNRAALRLRHALTPYMYSLVVEGHNTGVPPVRSIGLEFPGCISTLGGVDDQFMSGPFFFVAPVTHPGPVRHGVQVPGHCAGHEWFDFFTGQLAKQLPREYTLKSLEDMPLFVRAGAVIPLLDAAEPSVRTGGWGPSLRLEVFLPSRPASSSFTLFEDDGDSMAYAQGEQAAQELALRRTAEGWTVHVGASAGDFAGKPAERAYAIRVYGATQAPLYLDGAELSACASAPPPCVRWLSAEDAFAPTKADALGGLGARPSVVIETGPRSLSASIALGSVPPAVAPVPVKVAPKLAEPKFYKPRLADAKLAEPKLAEPKLATPMPHKPKLAEPKLAPETMTVAIDPSGSNQVHESPADAPTLARDLKNLSPAAGGRENALLGREESVPYWSRLLFFALLVVGAGAVVWYGTAVLAERRRKVLESVLHRSREYQGSPP